MTKRGAITLGMKLEALFIWGRVICGRCGQVIETQADCQWDHVHQLALDGAHAASNLSAKHISCHAEKTAEDAYARAKVRRLTGANRPKRKKTWPSRPIKSRGFEKPNPRLSGA